MMNSSNILFHCTYINELISTENKRKRRIRVIANKNIFVKSFCDTNEAEKSRDTKMKNKNKKLDNVIFVFAS